MLQPSPVPETSLVERLRAGAGRRTLGIGLALLIEALLLLALLTLGTGEQPGEKERSITVVTMRPSEASEEAAEESSPEPEQPPAEPPTPQPPEAEEVPSPPLPRPKPIPTIPAIRPAPAIVPAPEVRPPSADVPAVAVPPAPSARPLYGPPDRRGSSASRDSERVGTAPNGEPLYAAAWYREPRPDQLRAYLSTANSPGWGLIACRTAPDYRVEDCVGLDEYPQGSQITRAVLAAAWEFKVRPPQLGGRPLVGSWVRIRIDYSITPR